MDEAVSACVSRLEGLPVFDNAENPDVAYIDGNSQSCYLRHAFLFSVQQDAMQAARDYMTGDDGRPICTPSGCKYCVPSGCNAPDVIKDNYEALDYQLNYRRGLTTESGYTGKTLPREECEEVYYGNIGGRRGLYPPGSTDQCPYPTCCAGCEEKSYKENQCLEYNP